MESLTNNLPPYNQTPTRFERFKAKFLSLSLRAQIFSIIGLLVVISGMVVGATTIINPPGGTPGVNLYLSPTRDETIAAGFAFRTPGDQLIDPSQNGGLLNVMLDTGGAEVVAVSAIIDFDDSRLTLDCPSATNCPGITIPASSPFGTIAEVQRSGSQLRIVLGSIGPVSTDNIVVAQINFSVLDTAISGLATVNFNTTASQVIANDGVGTNIVDQFSNEGYDVFDLGDGGLVISNIQANVPLPACTSATVTFDTNIPATSQVFACAGSPSVDTCFSGRISQAGGTNAQSHSATFSGLTCNEQYFYYVQAIGIGGAPTVRSNILSFFTGDPGEIPDQLQILNLSVEPLARSAVVTWNTNFLSDSDVAINAGPGGTGASESIETLTHSLRITGLTPDSDYTITATSEILSTIPGAPAPGTTASDSISFRTEVEDLTLDSNIVLNVRRDRVCGEWLECSSSVEVTNIQGEQEALCFDLARCDELDPTTGKCVNFLPPSNDITSFKIINNDPAQSTIEAARNLSGNVKVGALWIDPAPVAGSGFVEGEITGLSSFAGMRQIGSAVGIPNGDFETREIYPWSARFDIPGDTIKPSFATLINDRDSSNAQTGLNRVLYIKPDPPAGVANVSGAIVPLGRNVKQGFDYYVSFDVRSAGDPAELIVQFGFDNYRVFDPSGAGTDRINITGGWQRIIAGPLTATANDLIDPSTGLFYEGQNYLGFLMNTSGLSAPYQAFFIDNVNIHPVLEAGGGLRVTKSCRVYPGDDAPSCQYFDLDSGRELNGWEGYCVEPDPRNPRRCIQWFPIDVIAGSQSTLSSVERAGYGTDKQNERLPLYYCVEAKGNAPYKRTMDLGLGDGAKKRGKAVLLGDKSTDWDDASGLIKYDSAKFRDAAFRNPGDIKEFELEQIVFTILDAESKDWPIGSAYSLNRGNNWETVDCDGRGDVFCPDDVPATLGNPNNAYYWKKVVDTNSACRNFGDKGGRIKSKDPDDNLFGFAAIFGGDGTLSHIESGLCDGSGGDGWLRVETTFYFREWCTTVAQVVDPFGGNTAWVDRIKSDLYTVPDLGYGKGQDFRPYGAIVPPVPDFDPERWDSTPNERGRQPLFVEPINDIQFFQEPYQARAGSPYGVQALNTGINTCTNPAKFGQLCETDSECTIPATVASCIPDSDYFDFGDGFCSDSGVPCVFGTEPPLIGSCPGVETCEPGWVCDGGLRSGQFCDPADPLNNPGATACSNDEEVGQCNGPPPGGICIAPTSKVGQTCSGNGQCDSTVAAPGSCGFLFRCSTSSPRAGSFCITDDQCGSGDGVCSAGSGATSFTLNSIGVGTCISGSNLGAFCENHQACGFDDLGSPGRCAGISVPSGQEIGDFIPTLNAGLGSTRLSNLFARSHAVWVWDKSAENALSEQYRQICFGPGECTDPNPPNLTYGWDITDNSSLASPPQIRNARIKAQRTVDFGSPQNLFLVNGQGAVTVSFNSSVESNQLPMVRYTIDWDDGRLSEESSLRVAPRVDESQPHVLSHTYFCEGAGSPGWNGTTCTFTPRIQIEDNWGWCSGAQRCTGSPLSCVVDSSLTKNYSGAVGCESWDEFAGEVVVCTPENPVPCGGGTPVLNINPTASALATPTTGNAPLGVQFTGSGVDPDGTISGYSWTFGDGGNSTSQNPTYNYTSPGTYTATLTVIDNNGGVGSDSVVITVNTPPVTPAPVVTAGLVTPASGTGDALLNVRVDYTVDQDCTENLFINGSPAGTNPVLTGSNTAVFTSLPAGTHTLRVECTNANGTGFDEIVGYVVNTPPTPINTDPVIQALNAVPGTTSNTTPFSGTIDFDAIDLDGTAADYPLSVRVSFDDPGQPDYTDSLPTDDFVSAPFTYTSDGVYDVVVTVDDARGGSATANLQIVVNWWNTAYGFKQQFSVTNPQSTTMYSPAPAEITIDTAALVSAGSMQASGNDLRIVYYNGTAFQEIDRYVANVNSANTTIRFLTPENIAAGATIDTFWIYYGNPGAAAPSNSFNNGQVPPADGNTVALYHFEDGSGTTLSDSVGSNNGTLINGPTWATGRFGGGLNFDGSNDYVNLGNPPAFALNNGTIELWVNHDNLTGSQYYFSKDAQNQNEPGHISSYMDGATNLIAARLQDLGTIPPPNDETELFSAAATDTNWHHVAVTFGTFGFMLHIDGVTHDIDALTTNLSANPHDLVLAVGNYLNPSTPLTEFFDGQIDGVRISNVARDITDMEYARNTANPTTSIVGGEIIAAAPATGRTQVAGVHTVAGSTDETISPTRPRTQPYEVWKPIVEALKFIKDIIVE